MKRALPSTLSNSVRNRIRACDSLIEQHHIDLKLKRDNFFIRKRNRYNAYKDNLFIHFIPPISQIILQYLEDNIYDHIIMHIEFFYSHSIRDNKPDNHHYDIQKIIEFNPYQLSIKLLFQEMMFSKYDGGCIKRIFNHSNFSNCIGYTSKLDHKPDFRFIYNIGKENIDELSEEIQSDKELGMIVLMRSFKNPSPSSMVRICL